MWVHGEQLLTHVMSSQAGIWFESNKSGDYGFIAKLPSNSIKALAHGCDCKFWVAISRTTPSIVAYVIEVADSDISPLVAYTLLSSDSPRAILPQSLIDNPAWFSFVDETDAVVMSAKVDFLPENGFLDNLQSLQSVNLKLPQNNAELFSFLDAFDYEVHLKVQGGKSSDFEVAVARCKLSDIKFNRVSHFNEYVNSSYRHEEEIQGSIQEVQAFQVLSYCFQDSVYHAPIVLKGKKKRELIDVLALSPQGTLLVESKCLNVTEDSTHSTSRQNKNLLSNCFKAVSQLEGAVRVINRKDRIFNNAELIIIDSSNQMHGVILISDFIGKDGWSDLCKEVIDLYKQQNIKVHVFSLSDFAMTLKLCSRNDSLFSYLNRRFNVVLETGQLEVLIRDPSLPRY